MGRRIITSASVPVMRLGHPLAFAGFLRSIGAPVDNAFKKARLSLLCDDPNTYVPIHLVRSFFEDMSHREVENLGWETGHWAQENHVHQDLIKRLTHAPTLGRALNDFSALVSTENSHYRLGLIECGEDVLFWVQDNYDFGTPGHHIGLSYSLMAIIAILRHFAGTSWQPSEISIQALAVPDTVRERLPETRIILGQKLCYIRLPRVFLGLPPEKQWARRKDKINTTDSLIMTNKLNYTETLRLVLETYLAESSLSAEMVAALIGTSSRTLRRRLICEGITFSELLDQVRFDVAKRLMNQAPAKMIDIAYALGYSDPSHFARGFRRMTGVSPSTYRRKLCMPETSSQD
ncbi:MAG: helix-turn-helix domain-containing protein [Gammaproteobacteria bacterium]